MDPNMPGAVRTPDQTVNPVSDHAARIYNMDVLRGLAILGISITAIWSLGGFTFNKQVFYRTGTHGGNYDLLAAMSILFDGKMIALFTLVFGAGLIWFIIKPHAASRFPVADLYIRRKLWLIMFGIFAAVVLLWPGEFLYHLAILGILLYPCWRLSPRALLISSIVIMLIYCGKQYWYYADDKKAYRKFMVAKNIEKKFAGSDTIVKRRIDSLLAIQNKDPWSLMLANDTLLNRHRLDTLHRDQAKDKAAWEGMVKNLKYDSTRDEKEFESMRRTNYAKVWNYVLPRSQDRESYWLYRNGIWEFGSLMLLGMALFWFGFFDGRFSAKKYLMIAMLCIAAGLALAWLRNEWNNLRLVDYEKYISKRPLPWNQFYPVEIMLLSTGYASLLLLLIRVNGLRWIWQFLEATGRMAFSNYFLQILAATIFFYGYGWGYFGKLSQLQLYFVAAELCLAQIVFSVFWLKFFERGPVEWIWRCLIYWRWFPNRRQIAPGLMRESEITPS